MVTKLNKKTPSQRIYSQKNLNQKLLNRKKEKVVLKDPKILKNKL